MLRIIKARNLIQKSKEAQSAVDFLNVSDYVVTDLETKPTSSRPRAPFITSTLQQTASTRLGFGVKKTMMLAQRLYEAGYITYMRTDSTNLSQDALNMARSYIENHFGAQYLPENQISILVKKMRKRHMRLFVHQIFEHCLNL